MVKWKHKESHLIDRSKVKSTRDEKETENSGQVSDGEASTNVQIITRASTLLASIHIQWVALNH